jgi:hypothetical protein
LTAVKEGMQSYWDKVYSRNSLNHMWILQYCNSRFVFRNFACPNMWPFYTLKPILVGIDKHVITHLSSKWKEALRIDDYKLYSSSRRHIPLFIRGRLHKDASEQIRIEVSHILSFHMQLYRWFLWLNNCRFGDFVDRIYLIDLDIKDTTDTYISASYLDLHLEIVNNGTLRQKDDYNFPIVNFPFICSSISAAPVYGVYISQLIGFSYSFW